MVALLTAKRKIVQIKMKRERRAANGSEVCVLISYINGVIDNME